MNKNRLNKNLFDSLTFFIAVISFEIRRQKCNEEKIIRNKTFSVGKKKIGPAYFDMY
jgi:hypothetical protein